MMNKNEAMQYGKRIGCKFFVYNSNGGLMGGFKTRESAESYMQDCIEKYKNDKLNSDMTFYVKTVEALQD